MKLAHISDTHLGYTQYRLQERKRDFVLAFERAIDLCLDKRVDVILHTGDLFESHQPDMATLSDCIRILGKAKRAGVEVFAITGNHDRALRRGSIPPQRILEELGMLNFIRYREGVPLSKQFLLRDGLFIAGLQYLPRSVLSVLKENLFDALSELAVKADVSVFMFHQGIGQYMYEGAYEMELLDLPEGFDYYAGGHIHTFALESVKGGVFSYAGSTEFRDRRDAEKGRRGFNIFHTDTRKVERVELEGLRPFKVLRFTDESAQAVMDELLEFVSSCRLAPVVLLECECTGGIERFRRKLEEVESHCLALKVVERKRLARSDVRSSSGKTLADFAEEFLKSKGYRGAVLRLSRELVSASPEYASEILKTYLAERLGENWERFKHLFE